jgi:hypothetical protein
MTTPGQSEQQGTYRTYLSAVLICPVGSDHRAERSLLLVHREVIDENVARTGDLRGLGGLLDNSDLHDSVS